MSWGDCERHAVMVQTLILHNQVYSSCSVCLPSRRWSALRYDDVIDVNVWSKTAVLVFKCLHGLAPAYLADYCQPTTVTAGCTRLRSANTQQLAIPRTNTGYGDRSFAVSRPSVWNSLPLRMSDCSLTTFRTQLKALLFIWYIVYRHQHFQTAG